MGELEKKIRQLTLTEEVIKHLSESFKSLKEDIAAGDMENINISLVAFERRLKRFGVI